MKAFVFVLLSGASVAWAAGGGHHGADPHAIPWKTVGVQAFNFFLLAGLLFYILKKSVVSHFELRLKSYKDLVDKAEHARAEAEKSRREIAERLNSLQSNADQSIQAARKEAQTLKEKLVQEAKSLAQRLEEDAHRSAALEAEKAKNELRKDLLSKALEASRDNMKKNLGSSEQKRLQNEFVEKIQVVRG